jgi:hypothetical protein
LKPTPLNRVCRHHMTKNLLVFLFLLLNFPGFTQEYIFQKDDSLLKKSYYDRSLKKKSELLSSVNSKYAKDYKAIYENQFEEIGNLIKSSRAVTAPAPNNYLQSVLQKIISANPELKTVDVRIIFSRDWWPNAYCMTDGTIAINAGLLVYLSSEAELAFVLCHELSHWWLDHMGQHIKKYVETINSDEFQKELKRLSREQYRVNEQLEKFAKKIVFDSRQHNRDKESEADRQAFIFLKRTGYDCGAIKSALSLLDKIDDTLFLDRLNLEQTLSFNEYPFKKRWIEKESSIFSQMDENDGVLTSKERDSLKTHPECSKRIALLSDSMTRAPAGKKFLVDETMFNKLKKDFLFEITEQCYRGENLGRNLYYSLLLLQSGENLPLAVYSVSRCLNLVYDKQKDHKLGLSIETESRGNAPDYNLLLRMLGRLRLEEIADLNYFLCKKYAGQVKNHPGFESEMNKARKKIID